MGSKQKTVTDQSQSGTQTNTLSFAQNPDTADIVRLRGMVRDPNQVNASHAYGAGVRRNEYLGTFQGPLGSYTSPATREAADRRAQKAMGMDDAMLSYAAANEASDQAFGQQSYVSQLTANTPYNSASSNTGTMHGNVVQSYNPGIGSYIAQGAGAALGAF